jgi:N utilization substance protein B
VLYQRDVTERPLEEILERWGSYRGELDEFAFALVRGVEREREALDMRLGEVAVGWPVYRMSAVDRTVLRLALYEMLHVEDVPAEVAVGEAMELAKGFSSEEAPQFVGGVLRGAKEAWLAETERHDRRIEHG